MFFSVGYIKDINKFDIIHKCSTEPGSSGGPIMLLNIFKVIGIHKGGSSIYEENYGTFLKFPIIEFNSKFNNIMKSINVINGKKERKYLILVLGKTGVGKTTLINSILNISNKNENGPLSHKFVSYYESQNNNRNFEFLEVALEPCPPVYLQFCIYKVLRFIKSKFKAKEPEKYIDCIWFCITRRFEAFERDWINNLKNQFKGIPLLIVYTLAININTLDAKNKLLKQNLNLDLIPVLAKSIRLGGG